MTQSRTHTLRLATAIAILAITGSAWSASDIAIGDMHAQHMAQSGHHGDRSQSPEHQKRMASKMAERQSKLKQALQITASQEPAWNDFITSMAPPNTTMNRPSREEMQKLTTPQRLERMQALKAERDKHMGNRIEAVKRFYSTLSPEQQKRFDTESHRWMGHGKGMGSHGDKGQKGQKHG